VLTKLGNLACRGGDAGQAATYYAEALPLHREHGDRPDTAETLIGLGVVAAERGNAEQATRLFGGAVALGEAAGYALHPPIRAWLDTALAGLRAKLGIARFDAAWDAGQALSIEQAVAEGLAIAAEPSGPAMRAPFSLASTVAFELSPREREVLRLVSQRLTDKEIGEVLSISHRTAMTHVTHILGKLGVSSRREAAAVAAREGLV
jgi:DNA-binding CsgD family transcriptional regulator